MGGAPGDEQNNHSKNNRLLNYDSSDSPEFLKEQMVSASNQINTHFEWDTKYHPY